MKLGDYNRFCQALPQTTHVVQWGGAHVWKVGGKVFAIAGWNDGDEMAVTFKCSPGQYDVLEQLRGCRPAPYLASRGMKWIQRVQSIDLTDAALKACIRESYALAIASLPKKNQREFQTGDARESSNLNRIESTPSPVAVYFDAADGLRVRADLLVARKAKAVLILCHRSHFNRGEYAAISPRLAQLGYTTLALDLRSGMKVLGFENETYAAAKKLELNTGYAAARPDIEAGIAYARKKFRGKPIFVVGSSYSASHALVLASDDNVAKQIAGVACFSPGEYLKGASVRDAAKHIRVPAFVAAAKTEMKQLVTLVSLVPENRLTLFRTREAGAHGARCLWSETPGAQRYWDAMMAFLERLSK